MVWQQSIRAATLLLSSVSLGVAAVPAQGELMLQVVCEERGTACNGAWQARYCNRFRLAECWTGRVGGGARVGQRTVLVGAGMSSPAALHRLRGSLLGLERNETLQYYLAEAEARGTQTGGDTPRQMQLSLSRQGLYQITFGEERFIENDAAYRQLCHIPKYSNFPAIGRAYNRQIDLVRTEEGVELTLGGGAFGIPYSPKGPNFPDEDCAQEEGLRERVWEALAKFTISAAELRDWRRVQKTRSHQHAIGGDSYSASVTLTLVEDADEVEVSVDAAEYESWRPEGGLGSEVGNALRVRLKVHRRGEPETPRRAKLQFALASVSREPGVCLNWPASGGDEADLVLRPEDNPELQVDSEAAAATREAVQEIELLVRSRDFGAFGVLRVQGEDPHGRPVKVSVRGKDTPDLTIPCDENHNHIADGWELQKVGSLGGDAGGDDEKEPAGKPGCAGDGLSLFEEYRGFRVRSAHVCGDPRKKDVFVCDRTSGQVAGPGIALFGRATKLEVRSLAPDELGEDRVINRNAGRAHAIDQHAIAIVDGPAGSDPEQFPVDPDSTSFGPPGTVLYVRLPPGGKYASGDGQADVAHELCHAVGLEHHGSENSNTVEWFWQLEPDGRWQLYEQPIEAIDVATGRDSSTTQWRPVTGTTARPIEAYYEAAGGAAARPFTRGDPPPPGSLTVGVERWRLFVTGERSPWSGDQQCLMRYYDKQAYVSRTAPARVRYLPDKAQWRMRDRLCENAAGTGVNAADHLPQPRNGDAAVGNCRAQLVVNDKYAGR